MTRFWLIAAAVLALALLEAGAHASGQVSDRDKPAVTSPPTSEPSLWMRQKRVATHDILDALTRADYDAIAVNAKSMLVVGYLEKFARADAPGYRDLMGDFQYANKALALAAREKNLDGATVAYVQLTISCVNCHKVVRDASR